MKVNNPFDRSLLSVSILRCPSADISSVAIFIKRRKSLFNVSYKSRHRRGVVSLPVTGTVRKGMFIFIKISIDNKMLISLMLYSFI